MENLESKNKRAMDRWAAVATHLRLNQLEQLDKDTVHIQCLDSTNFVLGRQTNFNGPVTIINCPDVLKLPTYRQETKVPTEEQIIIQEKVISQSAATKIHNIATSQVTQDDHPTLPRSRYSASLILCTGLLAATILAAPTIITTAPTKEEPKPRQCTLLPNNTCLYSQFHWRRRSTSPQEKPLQLPVQYLVISETYHDYCYDYNACLEAVRSFQLNRSAPTACNFLLGGDGNVYEDCGWRVATIPDKFLRICFMGDYTQEYPTYPQVQAAKALIQFGLERNYVAEDYALLGWKVSPVLYKVIYKWPRFHNETLFPDGGTNRPRIRKR